MRMTQREQLFKGLAWRHVWICQQQKLMEMGEVKHLRGAATTLSGLLISCLSAFKNCWTYKCSFPAMKDYFPLFSLWLRRVESEHNHLYFSQGPLLTFVIHCYSVWAGASQNTYQKYVYIYTRKPGRSPTRQYGVLRPFLTCAPSLDFFWVFQEDFSSWNSEPTSSTGINLLKYPPPTLWPKATRVKRSSPFRSTSNTGYITCLGMCKVWTEAVHSVAL